MDRKQQAKKTLVESNVAATFAVAPYLTALSGSHLQTSGFTGGMVTFCSGSFKNSSFSVCT
jgi:hypothetical protein